MILLPCKVDSINGYTLELIPNNKTNSDNRITARLKVSVLNAQSKEFVFLGTEKLVKLYNSLVAIYKAINAGSNIVKTVTMPNIILDDFIAVMVSSKDICIITLKSKHITSRNDNYSTTDTIELSNNSLFTLLQEIRKTLEELGEW